MGTIRALADAPLAVTREKETCIRDRDWVIRQGKKHERRKRTMRAIQKAIYEMDMEELMAERKRLQARAARERGRGSEGVRMISYRLRLIEGRMRQLTEKKGKAPGGAATPSEGRNNDTPVL